MKARLILMSLSGLLHFIDILFAKENSIKKIEYYVSDKDEIYIKFTKIVFIPVCITIKIRF